MLWCLLNYQGLLLPTVSRPLCQPAVSYAPASRVSSAVMMGDKPSKFEEDAAAFAAGIFKVADNAKAAAKLKKLEDEVETLDKFVAEKLDEADEVVETTKKALRAKSREKSQAKGATARAEARADVVSEQRDAAAALAAEAEATAKVAQAAQAKAEAERGQSDARAKAAEKATSRAQATS